CLVIQSSDIAQIRRLSEHAAECLASLGASVRTIRYPEFLDSVGALSCSKVIEIVDVASDSSPLILEGPLNFLNYWSVALQGTFWKHLAGFTHGPGIVVVDTPRDEVGEGSFRLLARLPGTDVRYLKSRLASTQDGLV